MTKPSFIRWSKWTSHVTLTSSSHRHGIIAFQDNGHSFDAVLLYGHEFSLTIFEVKQTSFCESVYLVSCYHKTEFSSPATRVLAYILLIDKVSLYDCCFRWACVLLCNCCSCCCCCCCCEDTNDCCCRCLCSALSTCSPLTSSSLLSSPMLSAKGSQLSGFEQYDYSKLNFCCFFFYLAFYQARLWPFKPGHKDFNWQALPHMNQNNQMQL